MSSGRLFVVLLVVRGHAAADCEQLFAHAAIAANRCDGSFEYGGRRRDDASPAIVAGSVAALPLIFGNASCWFIAVPFQNILYCLPPGPADYCCPLTIMSFLTEVTPLTPLATSTALLMSARERTKPVS